MRFPDPAARPRLALALVLVFGLLLQAPTLGLGFYADDYVHRMALSERAEHLPMRPWNLYDFGARADWAGFEQREGAFPWWTSPDWAIRFFRPLTSLTLWLDELVWDGHALGHHLTSLALYGVLLWLVQRLFLRLGLAPRTALLGLLVFTLSDASVIPVGWIANRNSVLEALFAAGALALAVGARGANAHEVPPTRAILGALACALGAALSKESGVFVAVLLALLWAWHARVNGPGRRRALVAAAAAGALFCAWIAGLALTGYGTRSLFYVTPWREPLRFAANLLVLGTGGLVSLAGPFPLDLATLAPESKPLLVLAGLALGVPLALWVAREVAGRAGAITLAAWTLVFLLPQGGVAPSDRLLFGPSLGAAGLLALFFERRRERARAGEASRAGRALAGLVFLGATVGSGGSLVVQELGLIGLARHLRTKALATDPGPPAGARLEVIVLQTESQMQAFTLGETWHAEGGDPRVRFWLAQAGTRALRWTRVSANAFELESLEAPFLTGLFERVYLAREPELAPGTSWRTALFTVESVASDEHGLRRLRFTLERPLDEASIRFVRPVDGVLTRLAPPEIGASLELETPVPSRPFVP